MNSADQRAENEHNYLLQMTTSAAPSIETFPDTMNGTDELPLYIIHLADPDRSKSFPIHLAEYLLRAGYIFIFFLCPWANYKLIQFFRTRAFYKESSAKWYIVFKAVCDTIFMFVSVPGMFLLTFKIDLIHHNVFTCKSITYIQYFSDDLISFMLTFLCIDRMIRITCGYRLRKRCSLSVCISATSFFVIFNIYHLFRLRHTDGFCHRLYSSIWDYNFDIYYSYIYISVTWLTIFITSINLSVSVCCDRARSSRLKQQQQQPQQRLSNISSNGGDSDRQELIHSTDDWEDPAVVVIEQAVPQKDSSDVEQQDNIDLQITVSVLITSAIFLICNLPNFIMFLSRTVFHSGYNTFGYATVYFSFFPLVIAHTISYFIFNHLTARLFPKRLI